MQKSTGTVTWLSHRNFGTILQAYALQKTINSLGYDNKIIDDKNIINSIPRKKFSILRLLRSIPVLYPKRAEFNSRNAEAIRRYDDFKSRYLAIDSRWCNRKELSERYDAFIAGSDQIWSPNVPFDDYYYLSFTDRPKIAYAPSLGVSQYPEQTVAVVKPLLEKFSSLSVREPQGAEILNSHFGLSVEVVCDPTLLLQKEDWNTFVSDSSSDSDSPSPYALCYFLTYNKKYIDMAREYCRKHSLQMKVLVVSHEFVGLSDDEVYTGPAGFIEYVSKANVILTDSFHGTIFSLIFNKPFYTFRRFDDTSVLSQNSRVENLLSYVGLTDRLIGQTFEKLNDNEITWDIVDKSLSQMRDKSLLYLKDSLAQL